MADYSEQLEEIRAELAEIAKRTPDLRDRFALGVVAATFTSEGTGGTAAEECAKAALTAYAIADAMILARKAGR